jgi:cephalosporin-C deacetylase
MPVFDLGLEQLRTYVADETPPADFDEFWQRTLLEAKSFPLEATFVPVQTGLVTLEAFDVMFNGYGGHPIKGWLLLPRALSEALPCVVEYLGYGAGRGFATDWLLYASLGYAHLVMDTRGQGSQGKRGDTPDPAEDGGRPHFSGFMTRGILHPETYFYRRVFVDAVRAIEAARSHPAVDASRVAVAGGSQGGGIALAAAALEPSVKALIADVPFLCHFRRAVTLVGTIPYVEIARYCAVHRDQISVVFNTLRYFDGIHFATRVRAPALFSVGLMDDICPPSTVFAAYNQLKTEKQIEVYEFNGHEGGQEFQTLRRIEFLARHFDHRSGGNANGS